MPRRRAARFSGDSRVLSSRAQLRRALQPVGIVDEAPAPARRPFPRTETHDGRLDAALRRLLPALDDAGLAILRADTRRLTLPAGSRLTLTDRGVATAAVVLSGRLVAECGDEHLQVGPGAVLNARALLASPRFPVHPAVTLRGLRPTRVALLPRARVHTLAMHHPTIADGLLLATDDEDRWGLRLPPSDAMECESIAIVRLSGDLPARHVARRLGEMLAEFGTVASGEIERIHAPRPTARRRSTAFVERQELRHRFVLLSLEEQDDEALASVLAEADRIVFVADADTGKADAAVRRVLWQNVPRPLGSVHLVLVHPADSIAPESRGWARHALVNAVHNIRSAETEGLARLARMLAGRASALVLTGADGRAWAGLGVLEALLDRDRVPDVICGVGLGATAARLFAQRGSFAEAVSELRRHTQRLRDWVQPPSSEIVRERLHRGLADTISDLASVDCWRPCITLDTPRDAAGSAPSLPALLERLSVWCANDRVWVVKARAAAATPNAARARGHRYRRVDVQLGRGAEDLRALRSVSRVARRQMANDLTEEATRRWRVQDLGQRVARAVARDRKPAKA